MAWHSKAGACGVYRSGSGPIYSKRYQMHIYSGGWVEEEQVGDHD